MEISFETAMLRNVCEDKSLATQMLGASAGEALIHRLADIQAADAIHEVLAGRPQAGKYQGLDCYRFDLADDCTLVVVPSHVQPRIDGAGNTDWRRVRRIRVIALESENDEDERV